MDKKSNNISVLKIGIKLLVFIIISCLCLYFIMKADKTTTNTQNTQEHNNNIAQTEENTNDTKKQINKTECIEDTDVLEPKSTFGWEKPIITNYAWESGIYYEGFSNVDGISAYNEYREDLLSKGYNLVKEENDDDATIYTYSKNGLDVILRVQQKMFEITLSK